MLPSIFLCIVLFSSCSGTLDEKAELVDAAVEALEAASSGSDDVLSDLSAVGQKAEKLMKAMVPIGGMAVELQKAESEDNTKHTALKDFRNRTEKLWRKSSLHSEENEANKNYIALMDYRKRVWKDIESMSDNSTKTNAELVDAAIEALEAASSGSDDVLSELNSFGQKAEKLLKAIIPIGGIVETLRKAESEDYTTHIALMDFRNRTEAIWRDIKSRIDVSIRANGARISSLSRVHLELEELPLSHMKNLTNNYTDPKMNKTDIFIKSYRMECMYGDGSPRTILLHWYIRTVEYCGGAIAPAAAQKLAEYREDLMRVLLRLRVDNEPFPDPGLYFPDFMVIYLSLRDETVINKDLNVFNRSFSSYREAVRAFFDEIQVRGESTLRVKVEEIDNMCLLYVLIKKSFFRYSYIESFVLQLKSQLIDSIFFAGICANLSNAGNFYAINFNAKDIIDRVNLISSHLPKWLNDSLASAWPSAHNQILQEHIMRNVPKPGYVDDRNLKTVADLAHPVLANIGLPNHVYEILIVRAPDDDYEHYFDGMGNHCVLNKGAFGFDTVIGRIPLNVSDYRQKVEVDKQMLRLSNNVDYFNITIQNEMKSLNYTETLPQIADTLKKSIGKELIAQDDHHCWFIARESTPFWRFWNPCPTIDYVSSCHNTADLKSTKTLSYTKRGSRFQRCEAFRFFFFT